MFVSYFFRLSQSSDGKPGLPNFRRISWQSSPSRNRHFPSSKLTLLRYTLQRWSPKEHYPAYFIRFWLSLMYMGLLRITSAYERLINMLNRLVPHASRSRFTVTQALTPVYCRGLQVYDHLPVIVGQCGPLAPPHPQKYIHGYFSIRGFRSRVSLGQRCVKLHICI